MDILFCCNPGYFQHLATAIASLLHHNGRHRIGLHVAVGRTDPEGEARLRAWLAGWQNASLEFHRFDWGGRRWPTAFHISQDTYIRLFAPEILGPGVDKLLYLDADLLVLDDLGALWETDVTDWAVAAAPDPFGGARKGALGLPARATYVNAGVLVMNLARWREEQLTARLSRYIEANGSTLLFHDQDALNAVLHDRIRVLDLRWNLQAKTLRTPRGANIASPDAHRRAARAPGILHYASARKPWLYAAAVPRKQLYYRYLQLTPWRGAPPSGRSLARTPELLVNQLLLALRLDYDWERLRRATTIGRGIDRLLGYLSGANGRAARQKIASTKP